MKLTKDGGANLITADTSITQITPTLYRLGGNLANLTNARGNYQLSVNGSFTDLAGNSTTSSAADSWQFNAGPTISPLTNATVSKTLIPTGFQLFAGTSVQDPESLNLAGGALLVSITKNANAFDEIYVKSQGTAAGQISLNIDKVFYGGVQIGTLSGGSGADPLRVDFNAQSTAAAAQALVRSIYFRNLSASPSLLPRTINLSITDGDGGISAPRSKIVSFGP